MMIANTEADNMPHDGHHHDHDHEGSELSPLALRVKALESLLVEKGYVDPKALRITKPKTFY